MKILLAVLAMLAAVLLVLGAVLLFVAQEPAPIGGDPAAPEPTHVARATNVEIPVGEVGGGASAEATSQRVPVEVVGAGWGAATGDSAVLEVLALDGQGLPAGKVTVHLLLAPLDEGTRDRSVLSSHGMRDPFGGLDRAIALTDVSGVARFSLRGEQLRARIGLLLSRSPLEATLLLEPPQVSQRVVLRLEESPPAEERARVEVSLYDADGRPRPGAYVDARRFSEPDLPTWSTSARTDEHGLAVFDELLAGEHEISHLDTATGEVLRSTVRTELGRRDFVELRPAPSRLAVAGVVVDEGGAPLAHVGVRVSIDGEAPVVAKSDADGAFRVPHPGGREVRLECGGGMWDDDFEPALLRAPFGTLDVRIRRLRRAEILSVEFACLDAVTGLPVDPRRLRGQRYRAGRPEEVGTFQFARTGNTSLLFRDHADWRVAIAGVGYARQELGLADAAVTALGSRRLEFRLERLPGFKEEWGLGR